MISRLRDGSLVETYDGEGKQIDRLYGTAAGRLLLRVLIAPWVSRTAGVMLDALPSAVLVKPFVRKNRLDLSDYPERRYRSFNDFFTRKIQDGKRPFPTEENRLPAPCDGKITVIPLGANAHFSIKGCDYTLESLLQSGRLSERYRGGFAILLRLTVDDYHRYAYPVSGIKGENVRITGVYHTVNPRAAAARPIYRENTREYTEIVTERNGHVLQMEIGAMLVGRIKNLQGAGPVLRGMEKGYFEFGGSSVLLLLQKGHFRPDEDLVKNSTNGEETVVHMGEGIGWLE